MSDPKFQRSKAQTRTLDDTLTPLEIAELLRSPTHEHLPFAIAPLLRQEPPVGYVGQDLSDYIRFYSANRGASTLVVAFCGNSSRLMTSISYFLQMLQDDVYDVLLLSDIQGRHYDAGIAGYSSSLLGTLNRLRTFTETGSYRRIVTYGTSMGGYAALRAGLWLGADRAISIGGAFCTHPPRLMQPSSEIRAFDLLCDCRPRGPVRVITAFAAGNPKDVEQQAALSAVLPDCVEIKINHDRHNVLHHLDRRGELRSFYATIFGEDDVSPTTFSRPAIREAAHSPPTTKSVWRPLLGRYRALFRR